MTDKIIKYILENRWQVFLLIFFLMAYGGMSISNLTIDAVPDITNIQVLVNTKTGGLDPEQVEKNITYYIENEMAGLPGVMEVRSLSRFGLSQVVVVFEDGTDIYRARQLITEKLQSVQGTLPSRITPELGPISTGLGEVVMYAVLPKKGNLEQMNEKQKLIYLRTIHDYLIKPYLKSHIRGVADIDSLGGYKKQIHIDVDPAKLGEFGVTFEELIHNFQSIGENYGGGYIEKDKKQIIVRTQGELNLAGIAELPVKLNVFGAKIKIKKIAEVKEGSAIRVGASTEMGQEAVTGIVLMLKGANSRDVSIAAEQAIAELPLPKDVDVKILYTRNYLIDQTLRTVAGNLIEGASLVVIILFLILGNIRAAFIVSLAIPLSMLFATIWMHQIGISANLMSLGAIDFGLLVDASVVLIENIIRNMELAKKAHIELAMKEKIELIIVSAKEVAGPVVLGIIIIMAVYVPILSLEGVEGKMFHPMAFTVLFALAGSLIVAILIMPVLGSIAIRQQEKHSDPIVFRIINRYYTAILDYVINMKMKTTIFVLVVVFFIFTLILFSRMGSDFIPVLDEGDLVINITHPSDISLTEAINNQLETEKYIMSYGEVKEVFSRMGTPESATDPMGVNLVDTMIVLKPDKKDWPKHSGKIFTKEELFNDIKSYLEKRFPHAEFMSNQPIEMRFNEILEGSRADVSVRIYGKDLNVLMDLQNKSVEILKKIEGADAVELDALTALRKSPVMNVKIQYDEIAKYNVHLQEVNEIVETSMAGRQIGYYYDFDWRFPIVVRLADRFKSDISEIGKIPVSLPEGGIIPIKRITDMNITSNVTSIARSGGSRYAGVAVSLSGRDVASFVKEAKESMKSKLHLPEGYRLYWGGQFKNLERAQAKLMVVIPIILVVIFFLVFQNFKSIIHTVMVYMGIPFAVTGGILALYLRGINFSVSAAIGFITLSGIAILNGMVLVSFIKQLEDSGMKVKQAVREGALIRLRPVIMTAMVASFGFLPMALNTGMGAEVQRPLATVVIGGLVTSTLLTLVILPMLYLMLHKERSSTRLKTKRL